MIERFRLWLRSWLGVESTAGCTSDLITCTNHLQGQINIQQSQIAELRAEVTRLSIAQYVPPSQPEPERKIIKTQTFKQYLDILEQEQSAQEAREDAIR